MGGTAEELGREAEQSDWVDRGVRFGLLVYGLVYLLIAVVAVQLALGDYRGSVTQGALQKLGEQPFGGTLLIVVAAGMVLLVLWRLLDAAVGHRDEDGLERWRLRGVDLFKAVVYGVIGYKSLRVATGDYDQGDRTRTTTARIMELPLGTWLVAGIGLGIAAYGARHLWMGLSEKFRDKLAAEGRSGTAGSAYLLLGKVGYAAKGVAFLIIGGLFGWAAVTHDPDRSGGLDEALHELLNRPYGSWLLIVMGVGIGCYGLFQVVRARHLSR